MPVVYVDAVMDLFHFGHVEYLKRVRAIADKGGSGTVIVGIHSDSDVESYKRKPVMAMHERIAVVSACKYVDKVVASAPLSVTASFVKTWGIDLVVHGGSLGPDLREKMYGEVDALGIYREIEYTPGISTTDIIGRLKISNL